MKAEDIVGYTEWDRAYKEGMKEVLDFIEQHGDLYYDFPFRGIKKETWQAKLKEWGIE